MLQLGVNVICLFVFSQNVPDYVDILSEQDL